MTYRELTEECAALGFEDGVGDGERFLYAARRALALLVTEYPAAGELNFFCEAVVPRESQKEIFHPAGTELSVPLSGKSYSFRVGGRGTFRPEGGVPRSFDTPSLVVRGYCGESRSVLFTGAYDYTVRDFAVFDACPPEEEEIPTLAPTRCFSLRKLAPDFLCPDGIPRTEDGTPIAGASVYGDTLILPRTFHGAVTLRYRRAPAKILSDDPATEIDVPAPAAHLFPLLTASYLWLDDEPERSQYYMNLYRTGMSALKYAGSPNRDNAYRDTLGWA
ncbi:MAG TPA: hypothetical protein DDY70_00770 [Clostridiales bacterium]|nr:hypothetical protein [Clostridiales bacterium]